MVATDCALSCGRSQSHQAFFPNGFNVFNLANNIGLSTKKYIEIIKHLLTCQHDLSCFKTDIF